jgi:predicted N-acyltransferase
MVDKVEVTVTDLQKKHKEKSGYENMYSVSKHVYMDNGIVDTIGFAIDKENLQILRAKIDAVLVDDDKKQSNNRKPKTDKINIISF